MRIEKGHPLYLSFESYIVFNEGNKYKSKTYQYLLVVKLKYYSIFV